MMPSEVLGEGIGEVQSPLTFFERPRHCHVPER